MAEPQTSVAAVAVALLSPLAGPFAVVVFAALAGATWPLAATNTTTRRQALLALLAAGKLDAVELIVQSSPRAVQIAWESAGTFERNNPLIDSLGSQAGFSDEDIDNLFEQAAKL